MYMLILYTVACAHIAIQSRSDKSGVIEEMRWKRMIRAMESKEDRGGS